MTAPTVTLPQTPATGGDLGAVPCRHCGRIMRIKYRGLCGTCYARHRSLYPHPNPVRPWTARERETLRAGWGVRPVARIAADIGRTVHQVYTAASRYGLKPLLPRRPITGDDERLILWLHAQGLTDCQIADRAGRRQTVVSAYLRRRGLEPHGARTRQTGHTEASRALMSRRARNRIQAHGGVHAMPAQRRWVEDRAQAIRMGWPQAGTLAAARLLDALQERPGQTTADLARVCGRSKQHTVVIVRGLRRAGLLRVAGHRRWWPLYALAPGVSRTLPDPGHKRARYLSPSRPKTGTVHGQIWAGRD